MKVKPQEQRDQSEDLSLLSSSGGGQHHFSTTSSKWSSSGGGVSPVPAISSTTKQVCTSQLGSITSSHGLLKKKRWKKGVNGIEGIGKLLSVSYDPEDGYWSDVKVHQSTVQTLCKIQEKYFGKNVPIRFFTIVGQRSAESGKTTLLNLLWAPGCNRHEDLIEYSSNLDDSKSIPSFGSPVRVVREAQKYSDALLANECVHCLGPCGEASGSLTLSLSAWLSPAPISDGNEMAVIVDMEGYSSGCWYREKAHADDAHAIAALPEAKMKECFRLVCDCQCQLKKCLGQQKLLQATIGLSSALFVNIASPPGGWNADQYPDQNELEDQLRPFVAASIAMPASDFSLPYISLMVRDSNATSSKKWTRTLASSINPVIRLFLAIYDRFNVIFLTGVPKQVREVFSVISKWPVRNSQLRDQKRTRTFTEEVFDLKFAVQAHMKGQYNMEKWNSLSDKIWNQMSRLLHERTCISTDGLFSTLESIAYLIGTTKENELKTLYYIPFISPDKRTGEIVSCGQTILSVAAGRAIVAAHTTIIEQKLITARFKFRDSIIRMCNKAAGINSSFVLAVMDTINVELLNRQWEVSTLVKLIIDDIDLLLLLDLVMEKVLSQVRYELSLSIDVFKRGMKGIQWLETMMTDLWDQLMMDRNTFFDVFKRAVDRENELRKGAVIEKYKNTFSQHLDQSTIVVLNQYMNNSCGVHRLDQIDEIVPPSSSKINTTIRPVILRPIHPSNPLNNNNNTDNYGVIKSTPTNEGTKQQWRGMDQATRYQHEQQQYISRRPWTYT